MSLNHILDLIISDIFYRPNIDSTTIKPYEMNETKLMNPQKSNSAVLFGMNVCKFIFELCPNLPKGKDVAVRIFKKRSYPQGNIKKAI